MGKVYLNIKNCEVFELDYRKPRNKGPQEIRAPPQKNFFWSSEVAEIRAPPQKQVNLAYKIIYKLEIFKNYLYKKFYYV